VVNGLPLEQESPACYPRHLGYGCSRQTR